MWTQNEIQGLHYRRRMQRRVDTVTGDRVVIAGLIFAAIVLVIVSIV